MSKYDQPLARAVAARRVKTLPGPGGVNYRTPLAPVAEGAFQQWVKANNVPWRDTPRADYDMRGFWLAQQANATRQALNQALGAIHYPDTFKTPYHQSFSNESIYAGSRAPKWVGNKLVGPRGRVIVNEGG